MEQLREGRSDGEGRAADGGGGALEEMRRPGDQDDGCIAWLANWAPLLLNSRAFEESAAGANTQRACCELTRREVG